jgi:hypothetical protein
MAVTDLQDMIVPSVTDPYVSEQTPVKSALFRNNVIQQTDEFDERASQKGTRVSLPFFKPLGRGDLDNGWDAQDHTDDDDITVNNRTSGEQEAVKIRHTNAWGSADLVNTVIDEDPLEDVGDRLASYWANDIQISALMELNGIFKSSGPLGSNASNDHFVDKGVDDGVSDTEVYIDGSDDSGSNEQGRGGPLREGMFKLGDSWNDIAVIAMHSTPYSNLVDADLIDFEPLSEQQIRIPRYQGRRVIVDDTLPFTAGTDSTNPHDRYTTYLMGENALVYGEGQSKTPMEVNREPKSNGGQEELISRRHYVVHPNGLAYTDTISGDTPSQSELETASDWSMEFDHKNIPLVAIETNG